MNESRQTTRPKCGKCKGFSGDDWRQCGGKCPVVGSPHFCPSTFEKYGDPLGRKPSTKT